MSVRTSSTAPTSTVTGAQLRGQQKGGGIGKGEQHQQRLGGQKFGEFDPLRVGQARLPDWPFSVRPARIARQRFRPSPSAIASPRRRQCSACACTGDTSPSPRASTRSISRTPPGARGGPRHHAPAWSSGTSAACRCRASVPASPRPPAAWPAGAHGQTRSAAPAPRHTARGSLSSFSSIVSRGGHGQLLTATARSGHRRPPRTCAGRESPAGSVRPAPDRGVRAG